MTPLPILKIGHALLRKKCLNIPAKEFKNPKFIKFLKDMVVTMRRAQGVGLAANQVGGNRTAIVLECASNRRYPYRKAFNLEIFINPRIIQSSKEMFLDWEGCLSIPGYRGLVPRSTSVIIEAMEINGRRIRKTVTGFHARVIQHEVDHINGFFYMDRMPNLKGWTHLEEFTKRHKCAADE